MHALGESAGGETAFANTGDHVRSPTEWVFPKASVPPFNLSGSHVPSRGMIPLDWFSRHYGCSSLREESLAHRLGRGRLEAYPSVDGLRRDAASQSPRREGSDRKYRDTPTMPVADPVDFDRNGQDGGQTRDLRIR